MKFTAVIDEVRRIIQDQTFIDSNPNEVITPRLSEAMLDGFANQALKRIAVLRPDLFIRNIDFRCSGGVRQKLPLDAVRLVEIYHSYGYPDSHVDHRITSIIEVNRETLDQSVPNWLNHDTNVCVNYMRNVRCPVDFLYTLPLYHIKFFH